MQGKASGEVVFGAEAPRWHLWSSLPEGIDSLLSPGCCSASLSCFPVPVLCLWILARRFLFTDTGVSGNDQSPAPSLRGRTLFPGALPRLPCAGESLVVLLNGSVWFSGPGVGSRFSVLLVHRLHFEKQSFQACFCSGWTFFALAEH